ncbi:TPA: hypothetical protein RQK25_004446 [Vibrio vulnificus]|nr:hypothetical protein [Vibrio vulnificus]
MTIIDKKLKDATALAKAGNFEASISLLKTVVKEMGRVGGYPHSAFCKIIPYFQKAGLYDQAETYCINDLFSAVETNCRMMFRQRNEETIQAFIHLHKAMIFDKLRLIAKRERRASDESRFVEQQSKHYSIYEQWFEKESKT